MVVRTIKDCRACGDGDLELVLDLGNAALANGYLTKAQLAQHELEVPLQVVLCRECGAVQLAHTVRPEVLYDGYKYVTGQSGTLKQHFMEYAGETLLRTGLTPPGFVIGIGGNDGTLEGYYQEQGFKALNIEASSEAARNSIKSGVATCRAWFSEESAKCAHDLYGKADLITCNNCFAHMPEVQDVARGVRLLLKEAGWFIVECADLAATLKGKHFDQFYHEHVFYWSVPTLSHFLGQHGIRYKFHTRSRQQGGSFRLYSQRGANDGRKDIDAKQTIKQFTELGWHTFVWAQTNNEKLDRLKGSIACYGWPAKATLLGRMLNFKDRAIAYAVDEMPSKQGLYTPGCHIPIVDRDRFISDPPDNCILTASNYADRIIVENPQYKGNWVKLFV